MTQSPLNAKEIIRRVRQLESEDEASDVMKLIYHSTDFGMSPIVDNPKVRLACCLTAWCQINQHADTINNFVMMVVADL